MKLLKTTAFSVFSRCRLTLHKPSCARVHTGFWASSSQRMDKNQVECFLSSPSQVRLEIRLAATCHLQTCYNLLERLAASLRITSFGNQPATSLLTTCNRPVVNKLSQAVRTHSDIGLLVEFFQDVNRFVAFLAAHDLTPKLFKS